MAGLFRGVYLGVRTVRRAPSGWAPVGMLPCSITCELVWVGMCRFLMCERGLYRGLPLLCTYSLSVPHVRSLLQGGFDTIPGEWADAHLAWSDFVPTRRARYDPYAPPLDPAKLRSLGLVLSRFEREGEPNLRYTPGRFALALSTVAAFRSPRPALALLTSAGVERNALAVSPAERAAELPIIQLNPGGILNWKYKGEMAVRASGLPYTIIRPTGLVDYNVDGAPFPPAPLVVSQGDFLTGKLTRADAALGLHAALTSGAVTPGSTFEMARVEGGANAAGDDAPSSTSFASLAAQMKGLVPDAERPAAGLRPLPPWVPPPPPPTAEQLAAALKVRRGDVCACLLPSGVLRFTRIGCS